LAHLSALRAIVESDVASLAVSVNSPSLSFPSSSGSNSNLKKHNINSFGNDSNNKENTNLNKNIDYSNINNHKNIITCEFLSLPDSAKVLNISQLVQKNKNTATKNIPLVINKYNNENKPYDGNVMEAMNLSGDDEIGGDCINSSFSKRKPRVSILLPLTPLKVSYISVCIHVCKQRYCNVVYIYIYVYFIYVNNTNIYTYIYIYVRQCLTRPRNSLLRLTLLPPPL
jgi:hypothetical protein